jgi:hypothetical protein
MEARASFRGAQLSPNIVRLFVVALLSVFLLGGAGGYLARGFSTTAAAPAPSIAVCPAGSRAVVSYTTSSWACTSSPLVVQQAPYSQPSASPVAEPTHDPSGRVISI